MTCRRGSREDAMAKTYSEGASQCNLMDQARGTPMAVRDHAGGIAPATTGRPARYRQEPLMMWSMLAVSGRSRPSSSATKHIVDVADGQHDFAAGTDIPRPKPCSAPGTTSAITRRKRRPRSDSRPKRVVSVQAPSPRMSPLGSSGGAVTLPARRARSELAPSRARPSRFDQRAPLLRRECARVKHVERFDIALANGNLKACRSRARRARDRDTAWRYGASSSPAGIRMQGAPI